jgi:sulfate adenylyltransferase
MILDDKTLGDLICLLNGQFSPLNTFMGEKDWKNVCENLHLENGSFFPLPITLSVKKGSVKLGEIIHLCDNTNYILAKLEVSQIYTPDINWECKKAYGTEDDNHPYVKYKLNQIGMEYITGELKEVNKPRFYDFLEYRLTPEEVKKYIKENNWKTIVGFQTRNPMHRAHYELTKYALNKTEDTNAKLLLNPVVGQTQSVDVDYATRVHCYKAMLNKYQENVVLLSLLPLTMRMAGPREACLHALIRKNYGCTHFVVGRDHAGPSYKKKSGETFYGPYEAQELFFKYSKELGIKPIVSKMIVYNETKKIYQPIDDVSPSDNVLKLSGTEVRNRLKTGGEIPGWFSYPEIVKILRDSVKKRGICYYFIGLSACGKTTAANELKVKLQEKYPGKEITILDGDIVRQNLSKGLGFSKKDRSTNVRRIGFVANEIVKHGGIVIAANIAPYDEDRQANRKLIESNNGKYYEIWMNTPLEICEKRDVKGLYKLAREGAITQFTGISDPFEKPTNPDFTIFENNIQSVIDII